jgi:hypothetical protein
MYLQKSLTEVVRRNSIPSDITSPLSLYWKLNIWIHVLLHIHKTKCNYFYWLSDWITHSAVKYPLNCFVISPYVCGCKAAFDVLRMSIRKKNGGIVTPFLTSALDRGEWSDSRPCCFNPGTHCIGGWMGPRFDLEKRKMPCPCLESNPVSSAIQPLV